MKRLFQYFALSIVIYVSSGLLPAQEPTPPAAPPVQGQQGASPIPANPQGNPTTGQPVTQGDGAAARWNRSVTNNNGQSDQNDPDDANAFLVPAKMSPPQNLNDVIDRFIYRENERMKMMRKMTPLVETYIQNMVPDRELGAVPKEDTYFLGKLYMQGNLQDISFLPEPGIATRALKMFTRFFSVDYISNGFAQMIMVDAEGFDPGHYNFKYLRREFLGEVRAMVFDVTPKKNAGIGRFLGRIWVEDVDYNIVRFNGVYEPPPSFHHYFHFDSWRTKMGPNLWLPTYVYTEESDFKYFIGRKLRFKAQTRLWGYDLKHAGKQEEFTTLLVDSVNDQTDPVKDQSPVGALRGWERQAENNVIERLEKGGLMAPDSEVNKVLETVLNNLEVTNNLDIQPEVRARVLLTSPLESFTIGHTVVISRGLLDVLPDEASLAMVMAHELAHIALGHRLDTKYAYNDRMLFADEATFRRFGFRWSDGDETEADQKAMQFLKKSPYADKLANAGLFLKAMDTYGKTMHSLVRPHLGNQMMHGNREVRMAGLAGNAPQLEKRKIDQIAALPLGGRVNVDGWSSRITLAHSKPVALLSAREKLPFEITPFMPYLLRQSSTDIALARGKDEDGQPANTPASGDNPQARPGPIADAPQPAGRHNSASDRPAGPPRQDPPQQDPPTTKPKPEQNPGTAQPQQTPPSSGSVR